MKYGINTLDDFKLKGQTVYCRVDINQPVDKETGELKDITRIQGSLETIQELSRRGAKTVLLAHQGSDVEYKNYYTLKPHAGVLENLLGRKVHFIEDVCGPAALAAIKELREGDILLLENVRFMAEELTLFETRLNLTPEQQVKTQVVQKLAPLGDMYVCDAFAAAHRSQPTLVAMEEVLPSAMGRLFEKEYVILSEIIEQRPSPCLFVLGGAKIQDAFLIIESILRDNVVDRALTGGLFGNVLLAASGVNLGAPSLAFLEKQGFVEYFDASRKLLKDYKDHIILPVDMAYVNGGKRFTVDVADLPIDNLLVDIGQKTADLYAADIKKAACVFANGPMGIFEEDPSAYGTKTVWQAMADSTGKIILGGGDSIAATKKYGLQDHMSYICTGGGAMVRFISGEILPAITALKKAAKKFGQERSNQGDN